VAELGRMLSENSSDWERVKIDGHADERGTFLYNLQLSMERAQSVRDILLQGSGSDLTKAKRIETAAYSKTAPIDPANSPDAWAKNRRVEVNFYGVKNPEALQKKLEELQEKLKSEPNLP